MTTATRKPFATSKPRSEWRKPQRTVFGRIVKVVDVSATEEVVLKRHVFELKRDGLHVRKVGTRRKKETVLSFEKLANYHKPQPELFPK